MIHALKALLLVIFFAAHIGYHEAYASLTPPRPSSTDNTAGASTGAFLNEGVIRSYDVGGRVENTYRVTPLNSQCYDLCEKECEIFSVKGIPSPAAEPNYPLCPGQPPLPNASNPPPSSGSSSTTNTGAGGNSTNPSNTSLDNELNSDIILNCRIACQVGDQFQSFYRDIMTTCRTSANPCPVNDIQQVVGINGPKQIARACTRAQTKNSACVNNHHICKKSATGRIRTFSESYDTTSSVQTITGEPSSTLNADYQAWTSTGITLSSGDTFIVDIGGLDRHFAYTAYLCGAKAISLEPMIDNRDWSIWDSSNRTYFPEGKYGCVTNKYDTTNTSANFCSQSICLKKALTFNQGLKNRDFKVNSGNGWPATFGHAALDNYFSDFDRDICKWSTQNNKYTPTYISPKDGDEMYIRYGGKFYACDPSFCSANAQFQNFFKTDINSYDWYHHLSSTIDFSPNRTITVEPSLDNLYNYPHICCIGKQQDCIHHAKYTPNDQNVCSSGSFPESFTPPEPAKLNSLPQTSNAFNIFGLAPFITDQLVKYCTLSSADPNNDCGSLDKINNVNFDKCHLVTDSGYTEYSLTGNLLNYSTNPSHLQFRIYDGFNESWYSDNTGGQDIKVVWKGCPAVNSKNIRGSNRTALEYGIFSPYLDENGHYIDNLQDASAVTWHPITEDDFINKKHLQADASGILYFRINPAAASTTVDTLIDDAERFTYPGYRIGSYYVNVSVNVGSGACDSSGLPIIRDIVNTVYFNLFGDKTHDGILEIAYKSMVSNSKFANIIRAMLIFYLTFSGLGFMLGVIQANTQEYVTRLIKIAVILTVTSPQGWNFIYENFFVVFVQGVFELVTLFLKGSYGLENYCINNNDPSSMFRLFDGPLKQLFSSSVWKKIYALSIQGAVGLPMVICILIAVYLYIFAMVKTVLIYLMSLIGIGLLIFCAPIFLPMALFKYTQSYFENWWRGLLSFALQSVFVMTGVGIFNILIILTIYSTFGFTVMSQCFFKFIIPYVFSQCVIPGYKVMAAAYVPNSGPSFIPDNVFTGAMALLILSHAMFIFVNFAAGLAGKIATGRQSMMDTAAGMGEKAYGTALTTVADSMDEGRAKQMTQFIQATTADQGGESFHYYNRNQSSKKDSSSAKKKR